MPPIAYVQRLRVEDAKRRLERTDDPIDEIAWKVGYEDPAIFRRLFKRMTDITPGTHQRRFQVPDFGPQPREAGGKGIRLPARRVDPARSASVQPRFSFGLCAA